MDKAVYLIHCFEDNRDLMRNASGNIQDSVDAVRNILNAASKSNIPVYIAEIVENSKVFCTAPEFYKDIQGLSPIVYRQNMNEFSKNPLNLSSQKNIPNKAIIMGYNYASHGCIETAVYSAQANEIIAITSIDTLFGDKKSNPHNLLMDGCNPFLFYDRNTIEYETAEDLIKKEIN